MRIVIKEQWREVIIRETVAQIVEDEEVLASQVLDSYEKEQTDTGEVRTKEYIPHSNEYPDNKIDIQKLYLDYLKKDSNNLAIMKWPESQILMTTEWFRKEAAIIDDDLGVKLFGENACIIPKKRI